MQELLDARKTSDCVRLEIADRVSAEMLSFLQHTLEVQDEGVFKMPGPLALSEFMQLTSLSGFDRLRYKPCRLNRRRTSTPPSRMFDVLARRDILLAIPTTVLTPWFD